MSRSISDAQRFGRPTLYKGIEMRSRLEAKWAAYMDSLDLTWQYEACCYADQTRQYLPDFTILAPGTQRDHTELKICHLEIKPYLRDDSQLLREQMEVIWESNPDDILLISVGEPNSHTFTPVSGAFWERCQQWQRGWLSERNIDETAAMWEICPPGDPYEVMDYEIKKIAAR